LEIAGGDETTSVLKCDFEVAVEATGRHLSGSIGAPKIPKVGWDDVGGLANVKSAVMKTIQLPLERPEFFAKGMKKRSRKTFLPTSRNWKDTPDKGDRYGILPQFRFHQGARTTQCVHRRAGSERPGSFPGR